MASSSCRRWPSPAFDPLARTTRFMLTEEAHHMFVGESGIARVIQRTCEVMRDERSGRCGPRGGPPRTASIDFDTAAAFRQLPLQRDARSVRRGRSRRTPAACIPAGSRAVSRKTKVDDDHALSQAEYPVPQVDDGQMVTQRWSPR